MDEVRRADNRNLLLAMASPLRLIGLAAAAYVGWLLARQGNATLSVGAGVWIGSALVYAAAVREEFIRKRFLNHEHRQLWELVQNRLRRFRKAVKESQTQVGFGLQEMPKTVERTATNLYESLRRADIVKNEIIKSEGLLGVASMPFHVRSSDPETNELYVLADKNVAEYRKHFELVSAKVTRTEGQCALFVSALDSLRVQLLGYRLSTEEIGIPKREFVATMREVQLQLDSINKALDELDFDTLSMASPPQATARLENHEQGPTT